MIYEFLCFLVKEPLSNQILASAYGKKGAIPVKRHQILRVDIMHICIGTQNKERSVSILLLFREFLGSPYLLSDTK